MPDERGAVVLTGASRGIGRLTAVRLAHAGFHVFAGVRSDAAAADLREAIGADRLTPVRLDVTEPESVEHAAEQVADAVGSDGLAGVVNNAATASFGPVETTPVSTLERELAVNVLGPVRVIQAFLPLLRAGGGRIVNVSSINGIVAIPTSGFYSASKFALEALSDALRFELAPWGIEVVVIQPGAFGTDMRARALESWVGRREEMLQGRRSLYAPLFEATDRILTALDEGAPSPEPVAAAVLEALIATKPKPRYLVGDDAPELAALAELPDRARDEALAGIFGGADVHAGEERSDAG